MDTLVRRHTLLVLMVLGLCVVPTAARAQALDAIARTLLGALEVRPAKLTVLPFTDSADTATELGAFLAEELSLTLFRLSKTAVIVDRTQVDVVVQEVRKGPVSQREYLAIAGERGGIAAAITGVLTPLTDTIRLSLKALDTASGRILAAATTDLPRTKAIDELLNRSTPARPEAAASATTHDFRFDLTLCGDAKDSIVCFGWLTNLGVARTFNIMRQGRTQAVQAWDGSGKRYQSDFAVHGDEPTVFGRDKAILVERGQRIRFGFMVEARGVRHLSRIVLTVWSNEGQHFPVEFLNVPVRAR